MSTTLDLDGAALQERIGELQRTFVPPRELTGSRPRDVELTAAGRALYVAALALFALALVAGLLLNRERRQQAADHQAYAASGTATTATVMRLWRKPDDSKQPWVAYRYVVGARNYSGEAKIRLSAWRLLHEGSDVDIRYLSGDPARSRLAGIEPQDMPSWVPIIVGLSITIAPILLLVLLNRQRRLLTEGRPAPALVTKFVKRHTSHGGSHRSIRYAFPLLSGSMATGRSETTRKNPGVGNVICIVYDPDCPRRSQPYPFPLVRPSKAAR